MTYFSSWWRRRIFYWFLVFINVFHHPCFAYYPSSLMLLVFCVFFFNWNEILLSTLSDSHILYRHSVVFSLLDLADTRNFRYISLGGDNCLVINEGGDKKIFYVAPPRLSQLKKPHSICVLYQSHSISGALSLGVIALRIRAHYPSDIWRDYNVILTSKRRCDVAGHNRDVI